MEKYYPFWNKGQIDANVYIGPFEIVKRIGPVGY
jgi:hypothetical protein